MRLDEKLRRLAVQRGVAWSQVHQVIERQPRATVVRWFTADEGDRTEPTLEDLVALAEYFQVPLLYLMDPELASLEDARDRIIKDPFAEVRAVVHRLGPIESMNRLLGCKYFDFLYLIPDPPASP